MVTIFYFVLLFVVSVLVLAIPYLIIVHGLDALDEAEKRWVIQASPRSSLDKVKLYVIRCGLFMSRTIWYVLVSPIVVLIGLFKLRTSVQIDDGEIIKDENHEILDFNPNGSAWYRDKDGYTYTYDSKNY
jgi:hypothetical protein